MTAHADPLYSLRTLGVSLLFALLASVAVAQNPAAPPAAAPAFRYWTTNWSFQDVDVRQLTERLEAIGIALPVEVAGDVSVRFRVSIPLNGLRQAQAYRFEGSLSSNQLRIDALQLSDLRAAVRYQDGVLQLHTLQTRWQHDRGPGQNDLEPAEPDPMEGQVSGSARAELVPRGELSADLQLQRMATTPLIQLLQRAGVVSPQTSLRGQLTGDAKLRCPIDGLRQPENWQLDAQLRSPNLQLNETPRLAFDSGPVTQVEGRFTMPELNVQYVGNPAIRLTGSVAYQWAGGQPFDLRLTANDVPTEQVAAMFGQSSSLVNGKVDLRLQASGTQQPPQWNILAQIGSPSLSVMGVELGLVEHVLRCDRSTLRLQPIRGGQAASAAIPGMRIGSVSADYQLHPSRFELSQLQAELFGGRIEGRLTLAREVADRQAEHSADLRWEQIRLPLSLPVLELVNSQWTAESSGTLDWRVPATAWQQPSEHRGTATLTLHQLQLGDVPIGNANIQLAADGQSIDLDGEGQLFGGGFQVTAAAPLANQTSWQDVWQDAWQADLELQSARLSNLSRVMPGRNLERLGGRVSGSITIRNQPEPQVEAQLLLRNVVYQNRQLTPQLRLDLRGDAGGLWLDRLEGRYAGGIVSGSGNWSLGNGSRQISLRATSLDLSTAVAPFSPQTAAQVDGYVSGTATITRVDAYRVKGAIQWHDGRLIEISIESGHAGFQAQLSDNLRSWQAGLNQVQLRTGRGQWTGDLHVASMADRRGLKMASEWKLRRVDFTDLFPSSGGPIALGQARASGSLTLGGRAIRGVQDLQGRFDVELDGTEARAVPGLPRTQNYLGAVSLGSVRFDEGRMRGSVGGGAVVLHEFWLLDEQLRVFADGSIRLADGRMDVGAVLNTGDFSAQNVLLRQLATTAGSGAIPLSVLMQANELLSNRTLIVDLSGPVSNPRVRLKTVDTLRANATEFFLRQARRAATAAVIGVAVTD
ncbi:AsmA-like C-terminal region-containing protein [Roseimaritima ulvae]|uniref:Uncharacterized protein n=1 Tax=Roseimaritima ulvae TaxID=980254 RepID=A0A5B9QXN1_9BACT|nr:AsmA-like C-terminal region-containing protein [Roseimaritima ulvae]QEG43777.1 hypothetical protein UC8_58320 [Roseimaritima ulvae]